jgi:acyl-CoA thioesterase FadM
VHHHLGVSGFATAAVVDVRSLVRVDPDVPPAVAALLGCAVLTGGGAVLNTRRPQPGSTVAVVGLGGVGMAALLTALAHDDVHVVAVDAVPAKLDAARDLGAHTVLRPDEVPDADIRAALVVEAAGSVRAFETAVALTAPGGSTVTVGLPPPDARAAVALTALVAEGRSIVGSYLGSAVPGRDLPVFVDLWRSGRLPVERLISSTIALDDINAVFYALFDSAINRWIGQATGLDPAALPGMGVVAESGCRYLGELSYPQDVRVGLAVVRIGTSSVTYRPALFAADDDVPAAVGRWVHVYVDRSSRRPVPIPDVLRSVLGRLHTL